MCVIGHICGSTYKNAKQTNKQYLCCWADINIWIHLEEYKTNKQIIIVCYRNDINMYVDPFRKINKYIYILHVHVKLTFNEKYLLYTYTSAVYFLICESPELM